MGRPPVELKLDAPLCAEIQRRLRAGTTPQRELLRLRILLASQGAQTAEAIAREVGVSRSAVERWRSRFIAGGLDALADAPRPGRPSPLKPDQLMEVIAIACEPLPGDDGSIPKNGRITRSIDDVVATAKERGVVESIGWGTVQRLLANAAVKPHRDQQWLHSIDPEFREKVAAICNLYLQPPAEDEVVLCIDEKPGMQALERKHPSRPTSKGRLRRQEFEYKRHGTQTLLAAFNVHTGKVVYQCGDTRKGEDLVSFMKEVAETYPGKKVSVIWDNLNIHFDGPEMRWVKFNASHGDRFTFTYTPKHASWVNQIECFFSILQRNSLNRGSFVSTAQLRETVCNFIDHWNINKAHPFNWTFTGYPLRTGVNETDLAA
jgi:transposase